jgi:hypothetical protein
MNFESGWNIRQLGKRINYKHLNDIYKDQRLPSIKYQSTIDLPNIEHNIFLGQIFVTRRVIFIKEVEGSSLKGCKWQ